MGFSLTAVSSSWLILSSFQTRQVNSRFRSLQYLRCSQFEKVQQKRLSAPHTPPFRKKPRIPNRIRRQLQKPLMHLPESTSTNTTRSRLRLQSGDRCSFQPGSHHGNVGGWHPRSAPVSRGDTSRSSPKGSGWLTGTVCEGVVAMKTIMVRIKRVLTLDATAYKKLGT